MPRTNRSNVFARWRQWAPIHLVHGSLCPRAFAARLYHDRFIRFCTAHRYAQHTDAQTTKRTTYVTTGRIYAVHAMRPKSYNFQKANLQ